MKKLNINDNTKIYVLLHTSLPSGGTELLHQLVFHLRESLFLNAHLYYPFDGEAIHPFYQKYKNTFVNTIEDNKSNILIYPEAAWIINIVNKYENIRKCMWWLSVDNFYLSYIFGSRKRFFFQRAINKLFKLWGREPIFDLVDLAYQKYFINNGFKPNQFLKDFILKADFHLAQSYYAINHLKNIGIPHEKIFYLSDYLNENFLNIKTDLTKKENIVAYNPKKGLSFTTKIIKYASEIKFVPIINMTRQEVIKTLQKAKVYIDFGNHPGKDRLPREAAILGCCVITGKRGSAKYFKDVPIPEEYKFEDKEKNIPLIVEKIKDCFKNFEMHYKNFENYRKIIKNEPEKFIKDLKSIFEVKRII